MDQVERARSILVENGYKVTEPRITLLEYLAKDENRHLTCEKIHEIVSKENPNIGIATVYRNMQLFEELDIVIKLNLDDGVARYELKNFDNQHQHHHLICLNCAKLIEVKEDLLGALEKEIEKETGFEIHDHVLKFYGYCSDCKDEWR